MTEQQWLASTDPAAMLAFITQPAFGPAGLLRETEERRQRRTLIPSDRKLRLCAVACWWQNYHAARQSPKYVSYKRWAEEWIDRGGPKAEVEALPRVTEPYSDALSGEWLILKYTAIRAAEAYLVHQDKRLAASQADLLRHIVGNPFRPMKVVYDCGRCRGHGLLDPETGLGADEGHHCHRCKGCGVTRPDWLTPTVLDLSAAIYRGDQSAAPVLHDALIDAGLDEGSEIVRHFADECPQCDGTGKRGYCKTCRGTWNKREGECMCSDCVLDVRQCEFCYGISHPRGCWALDLLLGKE